MRRCSRGRRLRRLGNAVARVRLAPPNSPLFELNDTTLSNPSENWIIGINDGGNLFRIGDRDSNNGFTEPFRIEEGAGDNLLYLDSAERIGINTSVPARELQINSTFPGILLDDITPGAGQVDITFGSNSVSFAGNTGSVIVAIDTRSPGGALFVNDLGNVGIGTSSPTDNKLYVNGDARVAGDVALGSSRSLKTAFDAVDPAEVLTRVADLPVASWRYKSEEEPTRHVGPFAEDFQRLFGLGDGETISVIDAQGVALAAIQGLQHELAERKAEVAALHQADAELRAELDAIKAALASR